MKTFKEFLNELFDNPEFYKETKEGEFTFIIAGKTYKCYFEFPRGNSYAEISFGLMEIEDPEENDIPEFKWKISDSGGNEIKIFSTVITIIKDYLRKHPEIDTIEFSSDLDEPSRVKLYDTMSKKLSNNIGFTLTRTYEKRNAKFYVLEMN